MPALSPTMTQGNLISWKKKVGQKINPGDVIAEVETDKAHIDFECQEEGFMAKMLVEEGTREIVIGKPVAVLAEDGKDVEKFKDFVAESNTKIEAKIEIKTPTESKIQSKNEVPIQSESSSSSSRIIASPLAKKIAAEKGIDLSSVTGSGPNQRILKSDVERVKSQSNSTKESSTDSFVDLPLSGMRKVIAQRLVESKQTIPHYYLTIDVEMDNVIQLREQLNKEGKNEFKLSLNDFVIKASAIALRSMPQVNSSWNEQSIRQFSQVDISVAVSTGTGLITPIVKDADTKGLATISNKVKELATKAKENKLLPNEFQGGSFTISNLGMYGIKQFTAIINPPQSCILAVGATEKRITLVDGAIKEKHFMTVTMSCDHRVVDGALGAQWLGKFKSLLEQPSKMLL